MIDFTTHIDPMFQLLGKPAIYTPEGGTLIEVLVITHQPDEIEGISNAQVLTDTILFDIRKTDIAEPHKADQVLLDGQTYIVMSEPVSRDSDRLIWTLSMKPE